MYGVEFGEEKRLADKTGQPLSKGKVKALDMTGQAGFFANHLMLRLRDNGAVRPPEVSIDDPL